MYTEDAYFRDAYASYENLVTGNRSQWLSYMVQEGLLFKDSKLCIHRCSMKENMIKNKHIGGLSGHFGQDKTFSQINSFYFWPGV